MYDTMTKGDYKYKRMTAKLGGYKPLEDKGISLVSMYRDYDVFFAHLLMLNRLWELENMATIRHINEWSQDELNSNCAAWWAKTQIDEDGRPTDPPFYVGCPLDADFPEDAEYFVTYPIFRLKEED